MTKEEYQEYLQSSHWHFVRHDALLRGKEKCALCSDGDGLEVHHNSYERLGSESHSDLVVLCAKCHTAYHESGNYGEAPALKQVSTEPRPRLHPKEAVVVTEENEAAIVKLCEKIAPDRFIDTEYAMRVSRVVGGEKVVALLAKKVAKELAAARLSSA